MNKQTNNPNEAEARGAAAAPHWTAGGRAGGWPGPGDRGARSARQGNRRASNPVPAHSDSEARDHAASAPRTHANAHAHTLAHAHHAHGRPDPDSQQGKQGVWPLGAQPRPWPLTRRWDPHREGQEPPRHGPLASSQQREPEGQEAGTGLGSGGPGGLSPPPQERGGRGGYNLETDLELSRGTLGPFSQPGLQWPSCLQCHECIVSFIHFKYKQNKNHIFFRQQQFSR